MIAVIITSSRTIAASVLDCIFHNEYGGTIVKDKVRKYIIDTIKHKVCLFETRAATILIGIVWRDVEVATPGQSIRLLAFTINLVLT